LNKIEKLLTTLVVWIFIGIVAGFTFGIFFGGHGGFVFAVTGFWIGCAVGLVRTVYLGFTYKDTVVTRSPTSKRTIAIRIFVGIFLALFLYTVFGKYLDPAKWNNPYTYEWGEATEFYFSRDGEVIVPRTIIDVRYDDGHYYGLRMSVDHYECDDGGATRFSNRRRYFILPIAEDAAIDFSSSDEFEAELKRRIPNGFDELDYSLFDEKWEYYSSFYAKNERIGCVIEEGA